MHTSDDAASDQTADSHTGSPGLDCPISMNDHLLGKNKSPLTLAFSIPAVPWPCNRRQEAMEKAMEITTADWAAHLDLAQRSLQGQTERECVKQRVMVEMEWMRLDADRERWREEREHELKGPFGTWKLSQNPKIISTLRGLK